ncbi:hypothetical protein CHY08_23445 (plasmid) [Rhizobium leguminosarum bv. viciae]|nr:hypothetical protein CHY08_23445 [Rhizobium leguminosarum bv. viciae]
MRELARNSDCGINLTKHGHRHKITGHDDRDPLYRRHRFPVEIIAHAVWLYFRFPLSLRMVENLLSVCSEAG